MDQELLALERAGVDAMLAGTAFDFFRDRMADDAVIVVPGMLVDKRMFLGSIDISLPWKTFELEDARVVMLSDDSGVVYYRARGQREGEPEYVGYMSSAYVKRDGAWRMAFHQQTPQPLS